MNDVGANSNSYGTPTSPWMRQAFNEDTSGLEGAYVPAEGWVRTFACDDGTAVRVWKFGCVEPELPAQRTWIWPES